MSTAPIPRKFRLRTTLVVPFVLQIVAAFGLVGYLSYRNGQQAVSDLTTQLSRQTTNRVSQQLNNYLATPRQANEINLQAINLGMLSPEDLNTTGRFFWKQMKLSENLSYMNFGSQRGEFIGVGREDNGSLYMERIQPPDRDRYKRYALDQQGTPTTILATKEYAFQEDTWYKSAVAAGKPIWSPIYQWDDRPEVISISSSYPVYDPSKRLVGVLGVDFVLSQISDFLRKLQISPAGRVFIIEQDGMIVASSSSEKPYREVDGKAQRLNVLQSQETLIRSAAKQLRDRFGKFDQITAPQLLQMDLNRERAFVSVTPWKDALGLNWLVVVVIPESDFMRQINASTRNTLWLCLAALTMAITIGVATARCVTRPILRISQASEDIAQGNIDQHVASSNLVEIDKLANSFNSMAGQMKASFDALRQSEARNRAVLDAIPDLILRIRQDGTYLDVVEAKGVGMIATRKNRIGRSMYDVLPTELAQQYLHHIQQVIHSGETQEFEYQLLIGERLGDYEARVVRSGDEEAILMVRDISDRKRTEAALRQNEERFRSLVANIPGAIYRCRCDADWTMEYISDSIATISGYPASDFIQNQVRTYASIMHPEDRDLVDVIVNHALVIQEPYFLDYRVLHQDGSIRWVYEQSQAVFDADENPLYLDGAIFDVTERKQAEETVRQNEERFRSLVSNIPGAIYRSQCDQDWTMEFISDSIETISSYPATDFIQNQVRSYTSIIHPEDRDMVKVIIKYALAIQEPFVLDYRIVHQDGSIRWVYEQGRGIFDDEDNPLYLDGAIFDVSDRKRAEEALRIAEENYRSIFENALEGIFQSLPDGRLLSANPAMAAIFGYDSPDAMIAEVSDIGHQIYVNPEDRDRFRFLMADYGQVKDFEFPAYQQDGDIVWVQMDARAVSNNSGTLLYYEGIIQDITDRKRREEDLKRQLQELKVEIDQKKRERDVAEITQSGYFQDLQSEVSELQLDEFWS